MHSAARRLILSQRKPRSARVCPSVSLSAAFGERRKVRAPANFGVKLMRPGFGPAAELPASSPARWRRGSCSSPLGAVHVIGGNCRAASASARGTGRTAYTKDVSPTNATSYNVHMDVDRLVTFLAHRIRRRRPSQRFLTKLAHSVRDDIEFAHLATPILPNPGESVALTFTRPRTAALAFDRVYMSPGLSPRMALAVAVYGGTEFEVWLHEVVFQNAHYKRDNMFVGWVEEVAPGFYGDQPATADHLRAFSELLHCQRGFHATPVYDTSHHRHSEYPAGREDVLIGALDGLHVVDENRLTWEQVLEFRRDQKIRDDYRRLVHWLDRELIGESVTFVEDAIAIRLELYEQALAKHGISTVLGTLESVLDPNSLPVPLP
jgi:hypothetical protein